MPCESVGTVWGNELQSFDSRPCFQNYTSLHSIRSQRLGSVGVSFSSDSEASMAQDSGDEFFNDVLLDPYWRDQCPISIPASTVATCVDLPSNTCADVINMTSYGQTAISSFGPTPCPTHPHETIFDTPSPSFTSNFCDLHVSTSQSLIQTHTHIINNPQCSSSVSSSHPASQVRPSVTPPDNHNFIENDIQISDSEDCENSYPSRIDSPGNCVFPNARTINVERNHIGSQPRSCYQDAAISHHDSSGSRQRTGKQPILSHFLYYALENPRHYGTMIKWVNRDEGIFEFQSKDKEILARAWGKVKNNRRRMTYPKMARALRKYIENGIVLKKLKNRLRYMFLQSFLHDLRSGNEPRQLSSRTIQQMYVFSRTNYGR